jgi:hypothetical protein
MTVVVCCRSEGVMAADTLFVAIKTQANSGNMMKVIRTPTGALVAGAGDAGALAEFHQWAREGEEFRLPTRMFKNFVGLILYPDKRLAYYESPEGLDLLDDFTAIGSGEVAARAARFVNASVLDCVRAAIHAQSDCGGEAVALYLEGAS